MDSKETSFFKVNFNSLGRADKVSLLEESSLTDKEIFILSNRFIKGLSLKECAALLDIEINSFSKLQQKTIRKFNQYIINNKSI